MLNRSCDKLGWGRTPSSLGAIARAWMAAPVILAQVLRSSGAPRGCAAVHRAMHKRPTDQRRELWRAAATGARLLPLLSSSHGRARISIQDVCGRDRAVPLGRSRTRVREARGGEGRPRVAYGSDASGVNVRIGRSGYGSRAGHAGVGTGATETARSDGR